MWRFRRRSSIAVEAVKQEIIDGKLTVPSTLDDVASFIETYCNK